MYYIPLGPIANYRFIFKPFFVTLKNERRYIK
jgi:hypothetical protein